MSLLTHFHDFYALNTSSSQCHMTSAVELYIRSNFLAIVHHLNSKIMLNLNFYFRFNFGQNFVFTKQFKLFYFILNFV